LQIYTLKHLYTMTWAHAVIIYFFPILALFVLLSFIITIGSMYFLAQMGLQ
jgi:hypothetical protein